MLSHDQATRVQYVTVAYQVQTIGQIRDLTPLTPQNPPALQSLVIPRCQSPCTLAAFSALVNANH
jgi:hypothetical protein